MINWTILKKKPGRYFPIHSWLWKASVTWLKGECGSVSV
jgi:hypothetical protein